MKRTNILVEVSDNIYDSVVTPHKKAKTFSKLIATLLKGYIENEYIRAYAEDTLDDMHKASVDALDEVIGNMQQSLASMGLYNDELKETTESGMTYFGEKAQSAHTQDNKEVVELRENVEELKTQNAEILSMLKQFMESGASVGINTEVKPKEVEKKPITVKTTPLKVVEVQEEEPPKLKEVSSSETAINGNDLLASLMQNNTYKY